MKNVAFRLFSCTCSFLAAFPLAAGDAKEFSIHAPLRLLPEEREETLTTHLTTRFEERFVNDITNRFITPYRLELLWREWRVDNLAEPLQLSRDGGRAFRGSARYTLREYGLEEVPLVPWIKDYAADVWENAELRLQALWERVKAGLPDRVSHAIGRVFRFFRGVLLNTDEENVLPSPFHPEEGVMKSERPRFWRTLKKGIRPSLDNPFVYASYPIKDSAGEHVVDLHARYYFSRFREHRFEFISQIPLQRWALGFGVQAKLRETDSLPDREREWLTQKSGLVSGTLALQGHLFGGILYGAFAAPEPRMEFGYLRSW